MLGSPEDSTAQSIPKKALFIFTVPFYTHYAWSQVIFNRNINYSLKGQIFSIINYIYRNMLLVLEAIPKVLLGHCLSPRIKQCTCGTPLRVNFPFGCSNSRTVPRVLFLTMPTTQRWPQADLKGVTCESFALLSFAASFFLGCTHSVSGIWSPCVVSFSIWV